MGKGRAAWEPFAPHGNRQSNPYSCFCSKMARWRIVSAVPIHLSSVVSPEHWVAIPGAGSPEFCEICGRAAGAAGEYADQYTMCV